MQNNNINPKEYSPLALAYMGDAIFELMVRETVLSRGNAPVNKLHKASRSYVNAAAQAAMYIKLEGIVTEEELAVMKRGRNAKSYTTAKNQSVTDYRHATGVESLFGYLYLKKDFERLQQLFEVCISDDND
jgi:ribonuclease-3 family protein